MKIKQQHALSAWGAIVLAGVLWGIGAVVAQWVIASGIRPLSLALARFVLGMPLLWWLHLRLAARRPAVPAWPRPGAAGWRMVALTGVAMALNIACWMQAIALIGAAIPTVLSICGAPVLVALVSVLRGLEQLTPRTLASLAGAMCGVLLLVLPGGATTDGPWLGGILWSLGSAVCYATVALGNARMPRQLPVATASALAMTLSAAVIGAGVAATGITLPRTLLQWLAVVYTGLATTSVAYLAFAWGARHLPPVASVAGVLIEPLVTALLAWWWFGQALGGWQWAGAVLLATALWLMVATHTRPTGPAAPS